MSKKKKTVDQSLVEVLDRISDDQSLVESLDQTDDRSLIEALDRIADEIEEAFGPEVDVKTKVRGQQLTDKQKKKKEALYRLKMVRAYADDEKCSWAIRYG